MDWLLSLLGNGIDYIYLKNESITSIYSKRIHRLHLSIGKRSNLVDVQSGGTVVKYELLFHLWWNEDFMQLKDHRIFLFSNEITYIYIEQKNNICWNIIKVFDQSNDNVIRGSISSLMNLSFCHLKRSSINFCSILQWPYQCTGEIRRPWKLLSWVMSTKEVKKGANVFLVNQQFYDVDWTEMFETVVCLYNNFA